MKLYKILDTDNVQDMSSNFIDYVFRGRQVKNEIFLNTCDGLLIYNIDDVEEIPIQQNIRCNKGYKGFMRYLMRYNRDMEWWEDFSEYVINN